MTGTLESMSNRSLTRSARRPAPAPAGVLLNASSSPPFAVMRVAEPVTSDFAVSEMLPPAPGPQKQGEPHVPVPPLARRAPAITTCAAEARVIAAPPPLPPAVQHAGDPP